MEEVDQKRFEKGTQESWLAGNSGKLFLVLVSIGITVQTYSLKELVGMDKRLSVIENNRYTPADALKLTEANMALAQQVNRNSDQINENSKLIAKVKESVLELKYTK